MAPGILVNEDVVMTDASQNTLESQSTIQPSSPPALPVGELASHGSDKENRKAKLEEMFDDEDDDEFMSSLQISGEEQQHIPIHAAKPSDPEVMRAFYQRLFPFRYLFQWLNHSPAPTKDFAFREFAFTLPNDAYLRYQSFPSAELYAFIEDESNTR